MMKLQKHDSYEFLNLSQMYDYLENIFFYKIEQISVPSCL